MAKWTDDDYEKLFANLGRYLIIFQWVEGKLDQILLLGWGHENWTRSHRKLSKMTNDAKILGVEKMVLTSQDFVRVHARPEWVAHFKDVVVALQRERNRRNEIIHSQILFEFADAGFGVPIMSTRKRQADKNIDFQRLELSEESSGKDDR